MVHSAPASIPLNLMAPHEPCTETRRAPSLAIPETCPLWRLRVKELRFIGCTRKVQSPHRSSCRPDGLGLTFKLDSRVQKVCTSGDQGKALLVKCLTNKPELRFPKTHVKSQKQRPTWEAEEGRSLELLTRQPEAHYCTPCSVSDPDSGNKI